MCCASARGAPYIYNGARDVQWACLLGALGIASGSAMLLVPDMLFNCYVLCNFLTSTFSYDKLGVYNICVDFVGGCIFTSVEKLWLCEIFLCAT